MRAVLLAHDRFGPLTSKTATCILRFPRTYETVAVLDRSKSGQDATKFVGPIARGIPIVANLADALRFEPEVLVLGIAPIGGMIDPSWRADLRLALEQGISVHSGMHTFLSDDPEFAAIAQRTGARIWDVRRPEKPPRIATGDGRRARSLVVHTMGSDCNSGKMTTTVEIVEELKRRGLRAAFAATGQTGIMIGCEAGAPIDRIISDFVNGEAERLVLDCAAQGFDVVAVEGQGAITHPAYSAVTAGLMHGCFPDQVVFCHQPSRTHHSGYTEGANAFPLLGLRENIALIEGLLKPLTGGKVVALSLITFDLDEPEARRAIERAERETGLPATDPVRFGHGRLVDAILERARTNPKEGARRISAPRPTASH